MKNSIIALLLLVQVSLCAQEKIENSSFHDISIDFGLFASLNSKPYENLVGEKYSIQTSYYFHPKFGFRTGFSNIRSLESTNKFYTIPLQLVYRSRTSKPSDFYISADSFSDFFFQLIGSFMPRQYEFHAGANFGYIEPMSDVSLVSINGGPIVMQGFSVEQRFVSTIDFGLRAKAKINRFSFTLSPTLS